jgi:hypothetical protein
VASAAHALVDTVDEIVKNLGKDQSGAVEQIKEHVVAILGSSELGWKPGLEELERAWQLH